MKSGILAAEAAFDQLESESTADLSAYEGSIKESWVWKELHEVRNLRPSFHNPFGNFGGIIYSGIDSLLLKGKVPFTFHNKIEDFEATKKARWALSLFLLGLWDRSRVC